MNHKKKQSQIQYNNHQQQQNNQDLPPIISVKEHLPKPIQLLPKKQCSLIYAHHFFSQIQDIESKSGENLPLDFPSKSSKKSCFKFQQYYDKNLSNLLKDQKNVLFISSSALLGPKLVKNQQNKLLSLNKKYKTLINAQIQFNQSIDYLKNCNTTLGSVKMPAKYLVQAPIITQSSILTSIPQQKDSYLRFNDNFECSNLYMALKVPTQTTKYMLLARFDYNTESYGQWFYFKVKNPFKSFMTSNMFTFMIINMTKNSTMFGQGLKVSVCRDGVWGKEGEDIQYKKNNMRRKYFCQKDNDYQQQQNNLSAECYYTLSFTLKINPNQEIYIAYNQPYTFTMLNRFITTLQKSTKIKLNQITLNRQTICTTPLSNKIQLLTITNPNYNSKHKRIIFITARTHPIQTAGSYVVEGIIKSLMNDQQDQNDLVKLLLQNYEIKIIPMVNPDGVIIGNSRCNLNGYDLNRQWKKPRIDLTRQIYFIKRAILKFEGKIDMFIDLHGHSKKKSVFAYGCHDFEQPFATRQFPFILSKMVKNDFLFKQCRFTSNVDRIKAREKMGVWSKDGTARLLLWDKLKIHNIFTIQNSYCCSQLSKYHYDHKSYNKIGYNILQAIALYFTTVTQQKYSNKQKSKKIPHRQRIKTVTLSHENKNQIHSSNQQQQTLTYHLDLRNKMLTELKEDLINVEMGLVSNQNDQSQSEQQNRISKQKSYENIKIKKEKKKIQTKLIKATNNIVSQKKIKNSVIQSSNSNIQNNQKIKQQNKIQNKQKNNSKKQLFIRSVSQNQLKERRRMLRLAHQYQKQSRQKLKQLGEACIVPQKIANFKTNKEQNKINKDFYETNICNSTKVLSIVSIGKQQIPNKISTHSSNYQNFMKTKIHNWGQKKNVNDTSDINQQVYIRKKQTVQQIDKIYGKIHYLNVQNPKISMIKINTYDQKNKNPVTPQINDKIVGKSNKIITNQPLNTRISKLYGQLGKFTGQFA